MTTKTTPTRSAQGSARELTAADRDRLFAGLRILIVEDIGMVANGLKVMLEDLGCKIVGAAARVAEAQKIVQNEEIDGVLLDLNLGGEYAFPLVEILDARRIPFIIMSGYDVLQLRPELADRPQMLKPFDRAPLEKMILTVFCDQQAQAQRADEVASRPAKDEKPPLRTRGELESAICLGMTRFGQEYLGRGPRDVRAYLLDEFLIVRMQDVLTAAEQALANTVPADRGRDLLKQVRTQLIESSTKQIYSMIQVITGVAVKSMHHDISTSTGEEVLIFTLSSPPTCRVVSRRDR